MPFPTENVIKAIKRGNLIIAARSEALACVMAHVNASPSLQEVHDHAPIVKIEEQIGAAATGLEADAQVLINRSREQAQEHVKTFNEPIPLELLVKKVASIYQKYSQFARKRPFGCSFLFIGLNSAIPRVFLTSLNGDFRPFLARAVGLNSEGANDLLSLNYKKTMKKEELFNLLLHVLDMSTDKKLTKESVRIGYITPEDGRFKTVKREKRETLLNDMKAPSSIQNKELFLINQALENIKEILNKENLEKMTIERKYLCELFEDCLIETKDLDCMPTLIPLVHQRFKKSGFEILYKGDLVIIYYF